MHKLQKSRAYFKTHSQQLVEELGTARETIQHLQGLLNYRPGMRNVSIFGCYNLALKRIFSHAGSSMVLKMMAGDKINGGLSENSYQSVVRFEHRTACAKHLRSTKFYAETPKDFLGPHVPFEPFAIMAHEIKCDATNQEAIGKHKIHVCMVASTLAAPE